MRHSSVNVIQMKYRFVSPNLDRGSEKDDTPVPRHADEKVFSAGGPLNSA